MAHAYEVIGDKLVVLDQKNYKLDNSDAPAFAGKLPCDDCEISYPRAEKTDEKTDNDGDNTEEPTESENPTTNPVEKPSTDETAGETEDTAE